MKLCMNAVEFNRKKTLKEEITYHKNKKTEIMSGTIPF
jgi:hypothetical protein